MKVIFQLTTLGRNVDTILESFESVRHWYAKVQPDYSAEYWLVTEPGAKILRQPLPEYIRVFIVPKEYRTPNGTEGKPRAQHYVCEYREKHQLSGVDSWIYHQDEETDVGEDTLLAIDAFVKRGDCLVGSGIILYPVDFSGRMSSFADSTRSYDDFRVFYSLSTKSNYMVGYHGSHTIIRSDVEDEVGHDVGKYGLADDYFLELKIRRRVGNRFGILKGFAYEKSAFTLKDLFRQRRRWIRGVLFVVLHRTEIPWKHRLTTAYWAISWFSALPSLALLCIAPFLQFNAVSYVVVAFTGFVWYNMYSAYREGYEMHKPYVSGHSRLKVVYYCLEGALFDVFVPWLSLIFYKTSSKDFITKDKAAVAKATATTGPQVADIGRSLGRD